MIYPGPPDCAFVRTAVQHFARPLPWQVSQALPDGLVAGGDVLRADPEPAPAAHPDAARGARAAPEYQCDVGFLRSGAPRGAQE